MIPLRDDVPSERPPIVTYGIMGLNLLVFLWELSLGPALTRAVRLLGVTPLALVSGWRDSPWVLITLLTSQFLHAGWVHFFGNMLYLWIFGDNVEDVLGRVGYTLFYLAAGVVAGLAQVVVAPSSIIPGIGASGAIAGVLAVYMILFPTAPVRVLVPGYLMMRIARVPSLIVLGFWFIIQLFNGFLSLGTMSVATGGVAWFAHIGGFVAGLVVGFLVRIRIGRRGIW